MKVQVRYVSALLFTPGLLITALGLFRVGIGFAGRPYISDFLGGIALLFEDQFALGDKVEIGDRSVIGVVERVLLRTIHILHGYSDQSHLIREFKSFAHCTPRDFAASAPGYFELRQNEDWCDFMKQYFNVSYAG